MANSLTDHQKSLLHFDKRPRQSRLVNVPVSQLRARRGIEDRQEKKRLAQELDHLAHFDV